MRTAIQLENTGNGIVDSMYITDATFGADRAARVAHIGKCVSLDPGSVEGAAKLSEAGEPIHGVLENVSAKGDTGGVVRSGYKRVTYTGTAPVVGATDGTGHVIASATDGVVTRCSGTWTAAEVAQGPKKVVSVRTSDTTCVIDLGFHSLS